MSFLWLKTWSIGFKSLLLHPMRSLLTVLGIFIGTASVIWLLAIGEGISQKAQQQIEQIGADNIILRSVKPVDDGGSGGEDQGTVAFGLTRADWNRLKSKDVFKTIDQTLPIREIRREIRHGVHMVEGRIVGCTPEYADVMRLHVDRGHFLSDVDLHEKDNNCVLAAEVAAALFPLESPIGKTVGVQHDKSDPEHYVVIGVMQPREATAGIGGSLAAQDFSHDMYIPIHTFWSRLGDLNVSGSMGSFASEIVELNQITLRVKDVDRVIETAALVRVALEPHHKNLNDVDVVVPRELLEQARTTRVMFMVFMGTIAAISLVVGGIGIMNIMLATVTERTREIGIRRALGAKQSDITRQFLAETVVLSVVGGASGVLGGLLCGPMIMGLKRFLEWYIPDTMENLPEVIRDVSPVLVTWSIPLAFFISVTVGVVFGLYPAIRAAKMDPIEALRHE